MFLANTRAKTVVVICRSTPLVSCTSWARFPCVHTRTGFVRWSSIIPPTDEGLSPRRLVSQRLFDTFKSLFFASYIFNFSLRVKHLMRFFSHSYDTFSHLLFFYGCNCNTFKGAVYPKTWWFSWKINFLRIQDLRPLNTCRKYFQMMLLISH